ncbi:MAG TPA: hypothetical protein PK156_49045, partial [Polyangium sp.]|nr:hypothetical protein [Polyangium sp.]
GGVDDVVRQIILTRINKVPAPSTKVRDVSPEFDAIVLRCLENDRARRYADAGEVARGLLAVASAGVPARVSATLTHHIAIERKATTEATAQDARTPTPTPMPPVRAPSYTRHGTEPMPRPEALIHSANTSDVSAQSATTRPASWRNEMAAWRAKREADATRNVELAETPGELQTASDAAFLVATNTGASTGTTSALGAFSQSDFGANPFDGSTLRARKRKKNASTLYALLGAGVVVTLLLIGLVLTAAGGSDDPADSTPSQSGSVLVPTSSVHAQRPESPPTPTTIASVSSVTPELAQSTALTKPAVNISAPITAPVKQIPVKQSSTPQKSGTKKPAGTTRLKSHDYFRKIQ